MDDLGNHAQLVRINYLSNWKKQPSLMISDGHFMYLSIDVMELEIENNIILMKLPPRFTDIMHPLDIAGFGPLKKKLNKVLNII